MLAALLGLQEVATALVWWDGMFPSGRKVPGPMCVCCSLERDCGVHAWQPCPCVGCGCTHQGGL